MNENIVSLQNVSLTYHSPESETLVLDNISFDVSKGEILGIVGPSGCGKTTILSLISGILSTPIGKISVDGENVGSNNKTGYMLQKDELFPWRTIMSNVMLGLELKKMKTPQNIQRAKELLKKYGLGEFSDFYPAQLSGGMRQRVALIRTLVLNPAILLLDEPFSALDFQTRLEVVEDVYKIIHGEKISAVFVTHDIYECISLCDRIVVLSSRPSHINKVIELGDLATLTPNKRREDARSNAFFEEIWNNLK